MHDSPRCGERRIRLVCIDHPGTSTKLTSGAARCERGEAFAPRPPLVIGRPRLSSPGCAAGALTAPWVTVDRRRTARSSSPTCAPNSAPRCKKATSSSWTTYPPTKARPPSKPSASASLGSFFCRPTAPTSIPSKCLRQNQDASARHGHSHHRPTLEGHRQICDLFKPQECANYPSWKCKTNQSKPLCRGTSLSAERFSKTAR